VQQGVAETVFKPDTIGLIPTGGCTGNKNYSRKAMMWLVYREQTDGCRIRHGRNGREFSPLKGACPKLRTGIISNCDKGLVNDIREFIFNVLKGNIKLTDCNKRNLKDIRQFFVPS
jgi:hypothetical protein